MPRVSHNFRSPPPAGFDPSSVAHCQQLERYVLDKAGPAWKISHLDPKRGVALLTRTASFTSVTDEGSEKKTVSLEEGTKESDGDRVSASMSEKYPGFYVTSFESYLLRAELTRLSAATARARDAISTALGVKPWKVGIGERKGGGYVISLPNSYMPSRHFEKLDEVAKEVVGGPGWYVRVDSKALTAEMIPSDPPTFPSLIPFPVESTNVVPFEPGSKDWAKIDLGWRLPSPGEDVGDPYIIDFESGMHTQVGGTSNSGKSVFLNNIVAGVLARGAELAIIDTVAKSVDFTWCKEFVRPGGWGCDSIYGAAATMSMIYEEAEQRAEVLRRYDVQNWLQLPASAPEAAAMKPIFVIMDEVTGLWAKKTVPKSLPKDHPMRVEAENVNMAKEILQMKFEQTAAEMRFVGVKLVLSSQVASTSTGIGTALRTNLQNKVLLGVNPTEGNRKLVFPDPAAVPLVPSYIQSDPSVGKGVGTSANEGDEPCVFKPYFAPTSDLLAFIRAHGVPTRTGQAPTRSDIERYVPIVELEEEAPSESVKNRKAMEAAAMTDPETGERMTPFEYANLQRSRSARKSEADAASGETG